MDLTNFNENNWTICLIKIASSNEEATVITRRSSCLIEYIKEWGRGGGVLLCFKLILRHRRIRWVQLSKQNVAVLMLIQNEVNVLCVRSFSESTETDQRSHGKVIATSVMKSLF